jgi:hypothetical protein
MSKPVHITHHALVRYLERVRGFKFDREIAEMRRICAGVTNGTVKAHGCVFEVKDGCLVTVAPLGDAGGVSGTKRQEIAER